MNDKSTGIVFSAAYRISKVVSEFKRHQLENELDGEYNCEERVEAVQCLVVNFGRVVEFHGQRNRVHHDESESNVLKRATGHEPPQLQAK